MESQKSSFVTDLLASLSTSSSSDNGEFNGIGELLAMHINDKLLMVLLFDAIY